MPHNESVQKLTRIIKNFDDDDDDDDDEENDGDEDNQESEEETNIDIINRNLILENGKAFRVINPVSSQNGVSKQNGQRNHNDLPSDDDEDFCDTSDNINEQVKKLENNTTFVMSNI
jgi:hypothetical protein